MSQMKMPPGQLRWRCRRGMKELDVLLTQFLDTRYDNLSAEQQAVFIHLLEYQDPDLYSWVTGKTRPEDPALATMVEEINRTRMGVQ